LTAAPRSTASLIRKIVAALILVPLAVIIIAFAVANRQFVTVSLDPFSAEHPAASITLPLFALILLLLIAGVLIGGLASWLRHGRWRRAARRLEREADALRREIGALRGTTTAAPKIPAAAEPPERLQLKPPGH
jgi:uncharacterized integral membrane protein